MGNQKIETAEQYATAKGWRDKFDREIREYDQGFSAQGLMATDPVVRRAIRDGLAAMRSELALACLEWEVANGLTVTMFSSEVNDDQED